MPSSFSYVFVSQVQQQYTELNEVAPWCDTTTMTTGDVGISASGRSGRPSKEFGHRLRVGSKRNGPIRVEGGVGGLGVKEFRVCRPGHGQTLRV